MHIGRTRSYSTTDTTILQGILDEMRTHNVDMNSNHADLNFKTDSIKLDFKQMISAVKNDLNDQITHTRTAEPNERIANGRILGQQLPSKVLKDYINWVI